MTQTTARTTGEELADLDKQIQDMEAELAEKSAPLVWGEATADELTRKEQRRGVLPRLITAAKIRRLELRRVQYEREMEPHKERRAAAYQRLEKAQAKYHKVLEEMGQARSEWGDANARIDNKEQRIKEIDREIRELRGEG